jgi:7-cyano-7-deazaguanine reductase
MKDKVNYGKIAAVGKYTKKHAKSGIDAKLPKIECIPNAHKNYEVTIEVPEYTSVCPKTGLPDFGKITIKYAPDKHCIELKSLKYYIIGYRNLGIFYENVVNRILNDIVAACKPKRAIVTGQFNSRGGMTAIVEARYPAKRRQYG